MTPFPSPPGGPSMKCQRCGQEEATVHITDLVQKVRRDRHLCEGCARAAGLFVPDAAAGESGGAGDLNLQALVQLVFGDSAGPGSAAGAAAGAGLTCSVCGLEYAAFRATGRLACPADYDAFRPALEPLLERIHRGTGHAGKAPVAAGLRAGLAAAVATEDYAAAAGLRDRLRQKERDG